MNSQPLSIEEEMLPPSPRGCGWRAVIIAVALLIAFAAGSWVSRNSVQAPASQSLVTPLSSFEKPVYVQITGRVKHPGVYQLPFNSRVFQAIEKAGGLLPDAATEHINLADWVKDGSQIIVPSKQESSTKGIAKADLASDASNADIATAEASSKSTFTTSAKAVSPKMTTPKSTSKEPPQKPIDLNRATSDELQQLPGVGPAMADRILQYRKDNQGFASVDDLNNVRGIGPKKFEKIKPFVMIKPLPF